MKLAKYTVAAMLLAASVILGTATSASASPYWQTFTPTSKYHCDPIVPWGSGVYTQTCIVINGNATQSVVLVRNSSGSPITIEAPIVRLWHAGTVEYNVSCLSSTLNSGFSRACFGPTVTFPCGHAVQAFSRMKINSVTDDRMTDTELMCVT